MMPSLRLCLTPCRLLSLQLSRPLSLGSNATAAWTPSSYQHTTTRTILQLSRREKQLNAIEGLLTDKEKKVLATKASKRAKWAERMQAEHGDNWEAIVEEQDRADLAARQRGDKPPSKKKNRWTQAQKDQAAVERAERLAAKAKAAKKE